MNHLQGGADAWSRGRGLAPSNNGYQFSRCAYMSLSWKTAGLDVVIELNWFRQFNQSNIIGKSAVIPVFMGESIEGGDFNTVWLTASTHIVSTSHDVKVQSILNTMGSSHDPLLRDEGTTTEPGVINKEGNNPGPLVLSCLLTSNNPVLGWGTFNSTFGSKVIGRWLGDRELLWSGWGNSDGILVGEGLGPILAEISGCCWPPVLLRPQSSALGNS